MAGCIFLRIFAQTIYSYMNRSVLKITLAFALTAGLPVVSMAVPAVEIIDQEIQAITVVLEEDGTIHVTGGNGQTLQVYNVAGVLVKSVKIDTADKRLELNLPKGCYIVKVGKTVRKISVK